MVGLSPRLTEAVSSSRRASSARPKGSVPQTPDEQSREQRDREHEVVQKIDPVIGRELDAEIIGEARFAFGGTATKLSPKKLGRTMPEMPFGPPVSSVQLTSTVCTIWPKPSVTMAR